jgi:hypothetical protein
MKIFKPLIALIFLGVLATAQAADVGAPAKIAWHGTWKGGLAEAQRTGKPILLVSGVPQCHNVPGVW